MEEGGAVNPVRGGGVRGAGLLASLAAFTFLWSCSGSDGGTEPETRRPTTLILSPSTVTLSYIGATTALTARILDQNGGPLTGSVTWTSDDPGVATVASGTITAVANGTTTVRGTSGTVTGTAAVTVQQAVSSLTVLSGNAQSAIAGETLAEPVLVRAKDLGGAAVVGATVTFTPDVGSGTVSVASATTDANGDATTAWTLGAGFGSQRLNVVSGGAATVVLTATSLSPFPLPDLVTGAELQVQRPDPSNLDSVQVQATVRNEGTAGTGEAFRVRLLADGAEIAAEQVAALEVNAQKTVTFTVGPFTVGTHTLRVEVDPEGAIDELSEENNVGSRTMTVVLLTPVEPGATLTGVGATENDELLYRLDLPSAANNLTVELSGGTGDVDLFMEAGTRPSDRDAYNDCQSGSPTTAERCQLAGVSAGPYYILLHAFSTFSGVTMTITLDGEVLPFNIEVVFLNHGSAAQDAAVLEAADRGMSLLPVDITDSDFSAQPLAAGSCAPGQPEVNEIVDDLRIYVIIDSIDGAGKTLAQASPCVTRGLGHLPILGFMQFDSTDLTTLDERGDLLPVVLHEMGHVLGFGTVWPLTDYVHNPSLPSNAGADTYFDGPAAVAAFDAAGGTSYTRGQKVPVENSADEGSADSHWRESALTRELMTPFFNSGRTNPLSAITVKSLADLGYQVDASGADPFTGSFTAPSPAPGMSGPTVDLSGDVPGRPLLRVDQKGRVVAVRR